MKPNPVLYTRYPWHSLLAYNGITVVHFLLGGTGLILGYASWLGILLGSIYLVFSFTEMYVLMPKSVCPRCPYYRMKGSLCVAGLNVVSRKIARQGRIEDFGNRARGILCPNNLYLASFIAPVIAVIPSLVLSFSFAVLAVLLGLVGLLALRFFVLFPKVACGHCRAKNLCPNAKAMGLAIDSGRLSSH